MSVSVTIILNAMPQSKAIPLREVDVVLTCVLINRHPLKNNERSN
jgi:hypothetical protein